MRSKVLLYFLAVGMISGWAVNDSNAMNMYNLRPMMPSMPQPRTIPTMQNAQGMPQAKPTMPSIPQAIPTMPSMPQPRTIPTMQNAQGMLQAKPTMPSMPQPRTIPTMQNAQGMPQAKLTMPSMPQVVDHPLVVTLTAEDRFKQRICEMMKSGSTELVIDEDYLGLNSEQCRTTDVVSYYEQGYQNKRICTQILKSIDDAAVASYIRNNVKTLVVNSGTINIAIEKMISNSEDQEEQNRQRFVQQYLNGQQTSYDQLLQQELERRQSSLNTKYNKHPLWFGALEHVILCNGSTVNVCQTNIQNRYDVTVKGASIDSKLRLPGMKKLYWWPDFGKYDIKDRSLELTSADQANLLISQLFHLNVGQFSKITFPKNVEIDLRIFNFCDTIAIDCKSTKFSFEGDDFEGEKQVIMNGLQCINSTIKERIIRKLIYSLYDEERQTLYSEESAIQNSKEWNEFLANHKRQYDENIRNNYYTPHTYQQPDYRTIVQHIKPELISRRNSYNLKYKYCSLHHLNEDSFIQYWRKSYEPNCFERTVEPKFQLKFVWPELGVLEKPDFTADDALLLARKAKLNVSDEIYIKEGIKWIGANSFASSTKLPHNCFFNVTIPDSVIDIDQGAFSNGSIQDIIVRSERVKKLVQESGFQKNIIVDANAKPVLSKDEQINDLQQKLMATEKMLALANRRLENVEVFLMSVCEFEPFYDYLAHYSFKMGKTYTSPQQWFKTYKKFNPHLCWPDEDNEPDLDSVTHVEDDTDDEQ